MEILNRAQGFTFNSLTYADLDDISINPNEDVLIDHSDAIMICNKTDKEYKIYWAAESEDAFSKAIEELSVHVDQLFSAGPQRLYMEFVHPDFIPSLERIGFKVDSHFVDYWIHELNYSQSHGDSNLRIRTIEPEDYDRVSHITKSCRGVSRGFHGEEVEFVAEWNEDEHSCIFIAELDGTAVGACFVNVYGFDSEKGPVLWLRELAVDPAYQNQGIGRKLIDQGLSWGYARGAKRSYLAVEKQNHKAVHLYQQFGYQCKDEVGQINMALEPVK